MPRPPTHLAPDPLGSPAIPKQIFGRDLRTDAVGRYESSRDQPMCSIK